MQADDFAKVEWDLKQKLEDGSRMHPTSVGALHNDFQGGKVIVIGFSDMIDHRLIFCRKLVRRGRVLFNQSISENIFGHSWWRDRVDFRVYIDCQ